MQSMQVLELNPTRICFDGRNSSLNHILESHDIGISSGEVGCVLTSQGNQTVV